MGPIDPEDQHYHSVDHLLEYLDPLAQVGPVQFVNTLVLRITVLQVDTEADMDMKVRKKLIATLVAMVADTEKNLEALAMMTARLKEVGILVMMDPSIPQLLEGEGDQVGGDQVSEAQDDLLNTVPVAPVADQSPVMMMDPDFDLVNSLL